MSNNLEILSSKFGPHGAYLRDSFAEEGKDDAGVAMHQDQRARPYEPRSQLCDGLPRPDGGLRKEVAPLQAAMCPSDGRLHINLTS